MLLQYAYYASENIIKAFFPKAYCAFEHIDSVFILFHD